MQHLVAARGWEVLGRLAKLRRELLRANKKGAQGSTSDPVRTKDLMGSRGNVRDLRCDAV